MNQHTGNWPGKTVSNANGISQYKDKKFLLVDIPGTYSIMSNSEEEEIARNYICFGNPDATVIVLDATCLERNLNLVYQIMEITPHIVVCVNLLDEAKKKAIKIDLKQLEKTLGVPVVGTIARKKNTLKQLMDKVEKVAKGEIITNPQKVKYIPIIEEAIRIVRSSIKDVPSYLERWIAIKLLDREEKIIKTIEENLKISFTSKEIENKLIEAYEILKDQDITKKKIREKIISSIVFEAENICTDIVIFENIRYNAKDRKIDKILTSKKWGIPIMILFLGIILWITIVGANYPSQWLSQFFAWLEGKLNFWCYTIGMANWLQSLLMDGVYKTVTWIIAVMLPPMAIFFPMFTLLEDLGYLPRIAFNLDKYFKKACSSRKTGTNYVHGSDNVAKKKRKANIVPFLN